MEKQAVSEGVESDGVPRGTDSTDVLTLKDLDRIMAMLDLKPLREPLWIGVDPAAHGADQFVYVTADEYVPFFRGAYPGVRVVGYSQTREDLSAIRARALLEAEMKFWDGLTVKKIREEEVPPAAARGFRGRHQVPHYRRHMRQLNGRR